MLHYIPHLGLTPAHVIETWLANVPTGCATRDRSHATRLGDAIAGIAQGGRRRVHGLRFKSVERASDALHGASVLRQRPLAKIVAHSLRHFDGERHAPGDSVVMPNHVHLLAAFQTEE